MEKEITLNGREYVLKSEVEKNLIVNQHKDMMNYLLSCNNIHFIETVSDVAKERMKISYFDSDELCRLEEFNIQKALVLISVAGELG